MAFKDFGGTLIDIDEIVAVQSIYGGGVDVTLRGGGVVKLGGNSKLDGKPAMDALVQLLSTRLSG